MTCKNCDIERAETSKFKRMVEDMQRGIHRWAVMAVKERWCDFGESGFYDADDLCASIVSYAEGNDLKYPKDEVK